MNHFEVKLKSESEIQFELMLPWAQSLRVVFVKAHSESTHPFVSLFDSRLRLWGWSQGDKSSPVLLPIHSLFHRQHVKTKAQIQLYEIFLREIFNETSWDLLVGVIVWLIMAWQLAELRIYRRRNCGGEQMQYGAGWMTTHATLSTVSYLFQTTISIEWPH